HNRPGGLSGGFSGGGLQGRAGSRLDNRGGLLSKRNRSRILGARKDGGKVEDNGNYLVGEEGPELKIQEGDVAIIPAHELALLSEETLRNLGVTPARNGTRIDENQNQRVYEGISGAVSPVGDTLFGNYEDIDTVELGRKYGNLGGVAATAGQALGATAGRAGSAIGGAVNRAGDYLFGEAYSGGQQQPAIPATKPALQNAGQAKVTPGTGDRKEYSEDNPYMTFVYPESYQDFLRTADAKELAGANTGRQISTIQPAQLGGATPEYQPPQADPRLQQMFDNQNIQQPGSLNRAGLNQPGAYSPADVHDRQAYINQRDSGQNLTKFTPTNFDASGLDNYNAQGLNTSGTIQGAIPWRRDPRRLSRDQVGQLQLQQNLGGRSAKDFSAAQLGQGQLKVAQQEAGTNYLKATQPQYSAKAVKQYNEFGNLTGEDLQSFQTQGEGAGQQSQSNTAGLTFVGMSKGRRVYQDASGKRVVEK
ncbi:MAG: hypothetical protein KAR12_16095, partial [Methylococcales bacterium]|nr:hypothetical protein [Methylococcales bacterium]